MDDTRPPRPQAQAEAKLLTKRDVTDRLSVSRSKVYQLIREGALVLRKADGPSRFRSDELDAYILQLPRMEPDSARGDQ